VTSLLEKTKQEHAEYQSEGNEKVNRVLVQCRDIRRSVDALETLSKTVDGCVLDSSLVHVEEIHANFRRQACAQEQC
jgi:hypothetical protein